MRLPIETERLTIRPLREDDAEAVHEVWSDPEVFRVVAHAFTENAASIRVRAGTRRAYGAELAFFST